MPATHTESELSRYDGLAPKWWDPRGPMRELHRMNPLRTGWVARHLAALGEPAELRLLDVGCGGGIAAEAFARLGFATTGSDGAAEAIGVARAHAEAGGLAIDYRVGLAGAALRDAPPFDAVCALEVIEHMEDQPGFVAELAGLAAPGGMVFLSTLNRTLASLAVAKFGAEYVARLLPVGTHDWRRFATPAEMAAMGRAAGLRLVDLAGMVASASGWREGRTTQINYIAAFRRDDGARG